MTTFEDYRQTAIELLLDAPLHLSPAEFDELLELMTHLVSVAASERWNSANDRPAGWS